MIKVNVINTGSTKTIMVDEESTIKEIASENGFSLEGYTISVDGVSLPRGGENKPLKSLLCAKSYEAGRTTLCLTNKTQNATDEAKKVKVSLMGKVFILTSTIKREDYELLSKYRKEALVVYENDEVVFGVGLAKEGKINDVSVTFGSETDGDGYARLTIPFAGKKDEAADKWGRSIMRLEKLEADLPKVIDEVKKEFAEIKDKIVEA